MGVSIRPDEIYTNSKKIFSTTFTFSGGGTQTVLSLNAGEAWIFIPMVVEYGGSDFRHGSVFFATRASNGGQIRGSYLGSQQSNSSFSTSGSYQVTYSAGGGNPYTTVYMLRLH
ncbi:hypothetical protein CRP235_gp35 [Roseobacter phage CRP-235]|nr:hypothetical protein CRP235_gp35 [Roseobacter phage CRP-235]